MFHFFLGRNHSVLDQIILGLFVLGLTQCDLWSFAFLFPAAFVSALLSNLVEGDE